MDPFITRLINVTPTDEAAFQNLVTCDCCGTLATDVCDFEIVAPFHA